MGTVGAPRPAGGRQSSSSPSPPRNGNWMSGMDFVRYLVGGSLVVGGLWGFAAIVWNTVKMHSKMTSCQEDISLLRIEMARDMMEVRKNFEILGQKVDLTFERVESSIQERGSDSDASKKEKKDISLLLFEMARDMMEVRKNFEILGQKVDLRFEHVESSVQESGSDSDTSKKEKNDISLLRIEMARDMTEVRKNFEILGQKVDLRFEHVESSIQESGSDSDTPKKDSDSSKKEKKEKKDKKNKKKNKGTKKGGAG